MQLSTMNSPWDVLHWRWIFVMATFSPWRHRKMYIYVYIYIIYTYIYTCVHIYIYTHYIPPPNTQQKIIMNIQTDKSPYLWKPDMLALHCRFLFLSAARAFVRSIVFTLCHAMCATLRTRGQQKHVRDPEMEVLLNCVGDPFI